MILVDADLLLYAYDPRAAEHGGSRSWLDRDFARFDGLTWENPLARA